MREGKGWLGRGVSSCVVWWDGRGKGEGEREKGEGGRGGHKVMFLLCFSDCDMTCGSNVDLFFLYLLSVMIFFSLFLSRLCHFFPSFSFSLVLWLIIFFSIMHFSVSNFLSLCSSILSLFFSSSLHISFPFFVYLPLFLRPKTI